MAPKSSLALLALAGAVSAYNAEMLGLVARQTDLPSDECIDGALSIAGSVPTPAPELMSVIADAAMSASEPAGFGCGWVADVPEEVSADFSSWTQALKSWYNDNSADLDSLSSKCPDIAGSGVCSELYDGASGDDSKPKPTDSSPTTSSLGSEPTDDSDDTSSGNDSSNPDSGNDSSNPDSSNDSPGSDSSDVPAAAPATGAFAAVSALFAAVVGFVALA